MGRDFDDFDPESDSQRGTRMFDRVCSAFIESVDEDNGTVTISFEDFIGTRSVELSFAYISAIGPGWFRFMPSIGDRVLCGFRPNSQVEILAYKAVSYPELKERAADGNPPFIFRKLKSGEFEAMSSGFAEIWGSKLGKLHLAGGLASIDLDRTSNSIVHSAGMHRVSVDESETRFGAVRRTNSLKTTEDEATLAPGVPYKEHRTSLSASIGGVATKLYEATFGKVLDYVAGLPSGLFTPRMHTGTAQPLRADIKIYTADGIQNVRIQTDEAGNTQVDLPASAVTGFKMVTALGSQIFEALNIKHTATQVAEFTGLAQAKVSSPVVVNVVSPMVNLGTDSPPYSVGLAEIIEARLGAIEAKFNAHVLLYNLHIHTGLGLNPTVAVDTPIIPNPTPTGSATVKVNV